ncbi:MAG: hypothetical protein ABFS12_07020 [Bacteroidota bacterium]
MNTKKIIWLTVLVQWCLSIIAVHKDAETILEFIGMSLWCTGGAIIFAFVFTITKQHQKVQAAVLGAFVLTSLLAIGLLAFLSIVTVFQGPLKEVGMIFIAFPFGYVKFGIIGAVIGLLINYYKNRSSN